MSVNIKIRNDTTMGDAEIKKSEMEMEKVEKIEKEELGRPVDFTELRDDLFREAAKLVSDVPSTKIAVFVTPPPSSESDVSMYSFGFPTVNGVVKTFLKDNCPVEDEDEEEDDTEEEDRSPQRFWWEDEKQFESMNPEQLDAAVDAMTSLRDRMILELDARLRAQGSGSNKDLHNDKADDRKP